MATEYYIVKPDKKQIFYLGKRISYLSGIPEWIHSKEAKYAEWEYWEDVIADLQENAKYFLEGCFDNTVGQIWDFCYKIYEFCDDKVYLDNDCNDENAKTWLNWEEIDVFPEIFKTDEDRTELEKWSELFLLIPEDQWVTYVKDGIDIVDEYNTVVTFIKKNL